MVRVNDVTGTSAFDHFVNVYAADGVLSEQTLVGKDGGITETVWDTLGGEAWSSFETQTDAAGQLISSTAWNYDETVTIADGAGASFTFHLGSLDTVKFKADPTAEPVTIDVFSNDASLVPVLAFQGPIAQKGVEALISLGLFLLREAGKVILGQLGGPDLPPGVPADGKYFFGTEDGTDYYITTQGQLWQVTPGSGAELTVQLPTLGGTEIDTDAAGTCTWTWINQSGSDAAAAYSQQITGVPYGLECVAEDGTKFDGFDYKKGVYLEAKANYMQFYEANGQPKSWYTGHQAMLLEMQRQVDAAEGTLIEWHVAEEAFAEIVKEIVQENTNFQGKIQVIWTPPK